MKNCNIPIFFSTDDNYVPFLTVAIKSLIENASRDYTYDIIVLNTGLKEEYMNKLKAFEDECFNIKFENVEHKIVDVIHKLKSRLRDYYSLSIYYRLFIPSLFPEYDKVIYLDADIVVLEDISKLYNEDIEEYLVGAVPDEVISTDERFKIYIEEALDIKFGKYFNSGVLVLNLKEFRKEHIESKFIYLLNKYNFDTVAPDQDYLNVLCKDKVKYVDRGWDRMPNVDPTFDDKNLHLIHYNMFMKPWKYENVLYEEYFWKYAKETEYYDDLLKMRENYTDEMKQKDIEGSKVLLENSVRIASTDNTFKKVLPNDKKKF